MKTSVRMLMLGAALTFTACPPKETADAGAPPAPTNTVTPPTPAAPPPPPPLSAEDKQKALYGFGALIADRTPVKTAGFTPEELAEVTRGMRDAALAKELE
ncbi:MAG: hypothetical protein ACO1OB_03590, partial [Archangium sp.]